MKWLRKVLCTTGNLSPQKNSTTAVEIFTNYVESESYELVSLHDYMSSACSNKDQQA